MIVYAFISSPPDNCNSLFTCPANCPLMSAISPECCSKAVDQVQHDDTHHANFIFFTLASCKVKDYFYIYLSFLIFIYRPLYHQAPVYISELLHTLYSKYVLSSGLIGCALHSSENKRWSCFVQKALASGGSKTVNRVVLCSLHLKKQLKLYVFNWFY